MGEDAWRTVATGGGHGGQGMHMCYFGTMRATTVGLRELRQQASELVRRAEAGDIVTVTVNGRPAARLVPPDRGHWRRLDDVAGLFCGPPVDAQRWAEDMAQVDGAVRDPWERP